MRRHRFKARGWMRQLTFTGPTLLIWRYLWQCEDCLYTTAQPGKISICSGVSQLTGRPRHERIRG